MNDKCTPYFIPRLMQGSDDGVKKMQDEFNKAYRSIHRLEAYAEERAAFEVWPKGKGFAITKFPSGEYTDTPSQQYWECWVDARADQLAKPQSEPAKSGCDSTLLSMIDNNIGALDEVAHHADAKQPAVAKLLRKVGNTLSDCRTRIAAQSGQRAGVKGKQS
ncbi:MAG: hypothetical protein AAFO57_00230 [Pseudomonadota bacterium]